MKKWGKHKSKVNLVGRLPRGISRKLNIYAVPGSKQRYGKAAATQRHLIYKCSQVANHYSQRCPEIFPAPLLPIVVIKKKGKRTGAAQEQKILPLFSVTRPINQSGREISTAHSAARQIKYNFSSLTKNSTCGPAADWWFSHSRISRTSPPIFG